MANLGKEEEVGLCDREREEKVAQMKEPSTAVEGEILRENVEKKGDENENEKLPKLSAADFRIYNSMAERMDYFVSSGWPLLPDLLRPSICRPYLLAYLRDAPLFYIIYMSIFC